MPTETILSIIGPTGSGKTALAGRIASHWCAQGESVTVIGLDSRQVYRELTQLSVADVDYWVSLIDKYAPLLTVCNIADRSVWEDWSYGLLLAHARQQLHQACINGQRVIVVGGTLVCHEQLLRQVNDETMIPPDDNIRYAAENMNVKQLQTWLTTVDHSTWQQLNHSDRHNPRRLVRKIEIALAHKTHRIPAAPSWPPLKQRWLVPDFCRQTLEKQVKARVSQRLRDERVQDEVRQVWQAKNRLPADEKLMSRLPLGFDQLARYLDGKWTLEQAESDWQCREWQYAKKQLTWVKKLVLDHHTDLIDQREILAD